MKKGILTPIKVSPESGMWTLDMDIEVEFSKEPTIGERFECFGKCLPAGVVSRYISTSPVQELSATTESGREVGTENFYVFKTWSGSEYELVEE